MQMTGMIISRQAIGLGANVELTVCKTSSESPDESWPYRRLPESGCCRALIPPNSIKSNALIYLTELRGSPVLLTGIRHRFCLYS